MQCFRQRLNAPDQPPFYFILPGFGFGLEVGGESHAYRVDAPISSLRELASCASRLICGIDQLQAQGNAPDALTKLFALWLNEGGQMPSPSLNGSFRSASRTGKAKLSFSSIRGSTNGLRSSAKRAMRRRLHATLKDAGCIVSPDIPLFGTAPVHFLPFCRHSYVTSATHGVIGEGKGVNPTHGEMGALAEGVERLLAMEPDYSRSQAGYCAQDLRGQGIAIPAIEAGMRDCYSDELLTDWVAGTCYPDSPAALPAELVWFHYYPRCGFRAFDMRQTIGLAAGATESEAFANGLLECIERDAYALLMRCRLSCPAISRKDITSCGPDVAGLLQKLDVAGIDVHMKWIRLDYPVPIAHVLLHDRRDRIPAHSHGCSAAFTPENAIARALFEAVQMHHGLSRFAAVHWENMAARIETCHSHPRYAWGDPLYSPTLRHLFNEPRQSARPWRGPALDVPALCDFLSRCGRRVFWTKLGERSGLTVVRVLVEGSVSPDSRQEDRSQRLAEWVCRCKLPGPYTDPILT